MAEHHWQVFIDWSGRNALTPLSRRTLRARREAMKRKTSDWMDAVPEGCIAVGDASDTIGLLLMGAVFLAILFTAVGPFVVGLAVVAIEVTIILLVAAVVMAVRTLFGRPWRVVAVADDGELWSWRQVGWGHARELEARIHSELAAGGHPSRVAPGSAIAEGMADVSTLAEPTERRWLRRTAVALLVGILVLLMVVLLRSFSADEEQAVDATGSWELVTATLPTRTVTRPLPLRIDDGLASGHDGCNHFSEQKDGTVFSTLIGCMDPAVGELTAAVHDAVFDGSRQVVGDRLTFTTEFVVLEYRRLGPTRPDDLFAVLTADTPTVDPTSVPFEAEGGAPTFDRLIQLDDGGHPAEFFIGLNEPNEVTLYVGLPGPPATSAESSGLARAIGARAITVLAGRPDIVALAALIPDSHLDDTARRQLEELGTLHGNLLIADPVNEGQRFDITNGDDVRLIVPFEARFQG